MNYKINPVKATCENLDSLDGIQAVNENCFGICAAFSQTYDTFEMDPNCVASCEKLVEQKRKEMFGVGRCDHQAPYRSVFWGQVPRYIPTLLKQGYDLETAKMKCNELCENVPNLSAECKAKCKLDSDAVEIPKIEQKSIKSESQPLKTFTSIPQESASNNTTLVVSSIFIGIIVLLILLSRFKKI